MNFDNFARSNLDMQRIVFGWLAQSSSGQIVERFIFLWMAFNGWGMCVTEANHDRQMIGALAGEPRFRNSFDTIRREDRDFAASIAEFSEWWPIYNAQDFRRKALREHVHSVETRDQLHEYARAWRVPGSPEDWVRGNEATWSEYLWVIYKVRCNLFHGQKDMNNETDRLLIRAAFESLSVFIQRTDCFNWRE